MTRPFIIKILWLFVRTSLSRLSNSTTLLTTKFARLKRDNPSKERGATLHRGRKGFRVGEFAAVMLFGCMLLGIMMLTFTGVTTLIDARYVEQMQTASVVALPPETYEELKEVAYESDSEQRRQKAEGLLTNVVDTPALWLQGRAEHIAVEKFKASGIAGFEVAHPDDSWRGTLSLLDRAQRVEALRTVGLFVSLANIGCALIGIGLLHRSIDGPAPALTWLLQFPVPRSVGLLCQVLANTVDNPAGVVTAIATATVCWACGMNFATGLGLTILLGCSTAATVGAIRLVIEIMMWRNLSRRSRGVAAAAAKNLGSLLAVFCMVAANSELTTSLLAWPARFLPDVVFWNPLSVGIGTQLMLQAPRGGWWLIAPLVSLGIISTTLVRSGALTRAAIEPFNESRRGKQRERTGASSAGIFRGLLSKELLQMRRQPEFLAGVLFAPVLAIFLLYLNRPTTSPSKLLDVVLSDAGVFASVIFTTVVYALMVAANGVLGAELRTLWFLQCQPKSLADCFLVKSRIWGLLAMLVALGLYSLSAFATPEVRNSMLLRAPFVLAYLWICAPIIFGMYALSASVLSETNVRYRRSVLLIAALIVAQCGLSVYAGYWWDELGTLVLLAVLAVAIRQKQVEELAWLTEPVESPPQRLQVVNGVNVLIGFLVLRGVFGAGLAMSGLRPLMVVSVSYIAAASLAAATSWIWMRRKRLNLPIQRIGSNVWRPLAFSTLSACAIGLLWALFIHRTTNLGTSFGVHLHVPSAIADMDVSPWVAVIMIVVAAPVFEEWLFRGLIYGCLRRSTGIAGGVLLSSLLFVLIHPPTSAIGVLGLAITTCLVYEKTKRLWPSIVVHASYNSMLVLFWNLAT